MEKDVCNMRLISPWLVLEDISPAAVANRRLVSLRLLTGIEMGQTSGQQLPSVPFKTHGMGYWE